LLAFYRMLASALPTTACIEADFSRLRRTKSDYRRNLSCPLHSKESCRRLPSSSSPTSWTSPSRYPQGRHDNIKGEDPLGPGHQGRTLATRASSGNEDAVRQQVCPLAIRMLTIGTLTHVPCKLVSGVFGYIQTIRPKTSIYTVIWIIWIYPNLGYSLVATRVATEAQTVKHVPSPNTPIRAFNDIDFIETETQRCHFTSRASQHPQQSNDSTAVRALFRLCL
jgi:hypothetical protein